MQKKNFARSQRVAAEIKRVLSGCLIKDSFIDQQVNSVFISITYVTVSLCLRHAKVYVAELSGELSEEDCLNFLQKHTPHLRRNIAEQIRLKFVPDLTFFVDHTFDSACKIDELLRSVTPAGT
ncbi:MAG: 30S ribosome-binding factor RbfA [Holosporaceae bacterium]|jgi:ribosome-binding factor A|nr:30S ribosome-binding factor RbfA [Holosporaceae bacterium]